MVAELFSVHPKTVARWSRNGHFPQPLRIGGGHPTRARKRYARDRVLRRLAQLAGLLLLLSVVT